MRKIILIYFIIVMNIFLLDGCGNYNVKPENIKSIISSNRSFIYGTYSYSTRQLESYLAFSVSKDGSKPVYLRMNKSEGFFFYDLEPGNYTIIDMVMMDDSANRPLYSYDPIPIRQHIRMVSNSVLYMGRFQIYNTFTFLYTDFNGMHSKEEYGISNIENRYSEDKNTLLSNYPDLSNIAITSLTNLK